MNQNISLQIFDELGKAFDWHQISDFNCHGTKYLLSVDLKIFFSVGLSHLILATPASCSPPHIILAKVGFKLWLILDSKNNFFGSECHSIVVPQPCSFDQLPHHHDLQHGQLPGTHLIFHFTCHKVCFWNWVSYITSSHCFCSCCCYCCPFKWL